jgi:hypothetical protein
MALSLATRLEIKKSASWEATHVLCDFHFVCLLFASVCMLYFLLLVDHVSQLKKWKYFTLLFGLVLTPPKSIFAKAKCKGKPQICF